MKISEIKKYDKIAILGYGKEGKSTLRFLKKLGVKDITILDKKEILEKEDGIFYQTGENYLKNISDFDLVIKTPGISPYLNNLLKYKDKIISSVDIFLNNYSGKVIGITGTKGKSTTSTVLYLTLQNAGYKVKLVGNIGDPVLDEIDILAGESYDYVVFELSSYMLEGLIGQLYIGYINNVYICHYDWHFGAENYNNAKKNILEIAKHKVANVQIKEKFSDLSNVRFFGIGTDIFYKDEKFFLNGEVVLEDRNFLLKGEHNRINICGIIAIISQIVADKHNSTWILHKLISGLKETLESFNGLPHRIQDIGTYKGITFVDDAIATTPDSTKAAINTFGDKLGTIFLGGQDSGFDFSELVNIISNSNIKNLVLFPDTGLKIFGDLSTFDFDKKYEFKFRNKFFNIFKTKSMESAVKFAYEFTEKGKICLLSTASPSFSVWNSYIEKGTQFQEFVKKYSI
ncbi:UDP-N-acetylmuramoyl-L-alanine--D-glutamate ligase [Candidatus Gracilibacteria bacterium]|nr:MAG: UDP-N-acetylmuramoyl-L-alanine--D-glutamate ligase [Candidatus Gracilibacteria bacterium]